MEDFSECKPIRIHCNNCGAVLTGYQNSKGLTKFKCHKCGVVCVSTYRKTTHELTIKIKPPEKV